MIKLKMIELIQAFQILNYKLGENKSYNITIKFKYKTALLIEYLKKHYNQYQKQLMELMNEYEIKIIDNQFINEDKSKLKIFLEKKYELDNIDIEIEQKQIVFDENINGLSANELLIIKPFFDFSELQ